jgi:hypothetical protein
MPDNTQPHQHLEMIGRPEGDDRIVGPMKGNELARGNIQR